MKINLEIDIKPFRSNNKKDLGLYTARGKRNNKARIEINSKSSMMVQIWTLFHEFGHFICDIYLGQVHKQDPKEEEREHFFCQPIADSAEKLFKKFIQEGGESRTQ